MGDANFPSLGIWWGVIMEQLSKKPNVIHDSGFVESLRRFV